ncbi:MAG: hypothetical protein JO001_16915 [Alphaproteobacteria bacterium]|nr:hypothetical protein [Alphaproteobacteria bacterium]
MIVAQTLIDQDVDDPSQVVSLPDQIESEIAKVMADGTHEWRSHLRDDRGLW